jgi:hypothetical protein
VDRLGEVGSLLHVGRRGLEPDEIGVRRVREPARDRRLEARLDEEVALGVRSPVRNSWSRSSTSLVISVALSASVRATRIVGTSHTSAASRAAVSVRTNWLVGTSTLPPRCPHFFSDASWSSKWTPAAPASTNALISSKALRGPPNPASASATIGASQWRPFEPSAASI